MSRPANAAGFLIHSAIHRARPDVNAACHFHSTYGKAWSAFAQPLEMLNQDVAIFYGAAQSVYGEFGGVVLEEEESDALAKSLGQGKGIILRNHGLLTVGGTVDEAAYLFLLMEKSCKVQLVADAAAAAGRKKLYMDDDAARFTYENTSDPVSFVGIRHVLEGLMCVADHGIGESVRRVSGLFAVGVGYIARWVQGFVILYLNRPAIDCYRTLFIKSTHHLT
jgi:hypothetical protein